MLFEKGVSWWDVFAASDIGSERNLIANRFVAQGSEILDVGCGRGFFSFACAKRASHVIGLDSMDGGGRVGWWDEFKATSRLLGVSDQVAGVKASATAIPSASFRFDVVASVHSIRNFGDISEIRAFFGQASKVLKKEGRLVVVESDLEDSECRAYRAFYSMRAKLGWELKLPSTQDMVGWLHAEGFSKVSRESIEADLKYAPVRFPFDSLSMKAMKEDYEIAVKLLQDDGERHPAIFVLIATR